MRRIIVGRGENARDFPPSGGIQPVTGGSEAGFGSP
jgi:hypothetical protein